MSSFALHLVRPFIVNYPVSEVKAADLVEGTGLADGTLSQERAVLQTLLRDLNSDISFPVVHRTAQSLGSLPSLDDRECEALKRAILNKLIIAQYVHSVDTCLDHAARAEAEAEWWANIERSRWNLLYYLLQTLPTRLLNLAAAVLNIQHRPIALSFFSTGSFSHLFSHTDSGHSNPLSTAFFPHLRHRPFSVTSSTVLFSSLRSFSYLNGHFPTTFRSILDPLWTWAALPVDLTRQECHFKRKELEKIRDQEAEALGRLTQMRADLATTFTELRDATDIQPLLGVLASVIEGESYCDTDVGYSDERRPLFDFLAFSSTMFTTQRFHKQSVQQLGRPSWLVLSWPRLLLLPPLFLHCLRSVYASRKTLTDFFCDTSTTVRLFLRDWLIDPLRDVLCTVRAGGENGVIVRKEGVLADFESLERMALSLAKDKLHYEPEQLDFLSQRIRHGDLTPVLRLYEEDIRNPLKSAIAGTLLRSLLIQIQKAKVDLDQALSGIDRLLKSQELTFAFVGVAPALGITYLACTSSFSLIRGGVGRGNYGGRRKRAGVWNAMRRIERLLVSGSKLPKGSCDAENLMSPLTSGLLLLSVSRLRMYAEAHLPPESILREGFLEDVADLENPDLGRSDKMKVVHRMWRCWGGTLGWNKIPGY